MSSVVLKRFQRLTEDALRKQTQEGLAKVFEKLSCKGVASQIKKGVDVTGNAEYGTRLCVHDKLGPTVNVETWKFSPMTKREREMEHKFVDNVNKMLKNGGFREMNPKLIQQLRKRDREFEQQVKMRKK